MATKEFKKVDLEFPDFSRHYVYVCDLYYNKDKDVYFMNYVDSTDKGIYTAVLSRVNGKLLKNPFIDTRTLQEIALGAEYANIYDLPDEINCLKVPLKKSDKQKIKQFTVYTNDRNEFFIRLELANRFGISIEDKEVIDYNNIKIVRVTHDEVIRIINLTRNDSIGLEPVYSSIVKTQKHSTFKVLVEVLRNNNNMYISRDLAKKYGIDHGLAFKKDGVEWTKVTLHDIENVEETAKNSQKSLKANYVKINKLPEKKSKKSFTVVIDILDYENDLYVKKNVADIHNISGRMFAYDSTTWIRVTESDLTKIKKSYNDRNALVEFNFQKVNKTRKISEEFVLELNNKKYVSLDLIDNYSIEKKESINYNGKKYFRVSDADLRKISVLSFYSGKPFNYRVLTIYSYNEKTARESKTINLNYCIIDGLIYIPHYFVTELDRMNGKKIRVDGIVYVSVTNGRFNEIYDALVEEHKNVNRINIEVEKIDDNKKVTDRKKITK